MLYLLYMKDISKSYLSKKINKLNKKIHRAENQNDENKIWWRKMKLEKLQDKLPPFNYDEARQILKSEVGDTQFNQISNFTEPTIPTLPRFLAIFPDNSMESLSEDAAVIITESEPTPLVNSKIS